MKIQLLKSAFKRSLFSLVFLTCAALPRPSSGQDPTPTPTPIPTVIETFGVADDGTPLHWVVYTPQGNGPWPVVFVIHGGGFRAGNNEEPPNMKSAAEALRSAGYLALSLEYRLAPPGLIDGQSSDGRYPDQINDCKLAVRAVRADPRCNGQIGAVGGSAGATHATYLAADGTPGDDKIDVAVGLSGAYDFADPESLDSSPGFKAKVENYCFADVPPPEPEYSSALFSASVVSKVTGSASPMMLVQSDNESMPAPQMGALAAAFDAAGAPIYETILIPGTRHSWEIGRS